MGATSWFTLNQGARVTFTVTHRLAGRKVHGICVAPTVRNRHKPTCQRTVTVATFTESGHRGRNHLAVETLVVHGKKLAPGRYTLTITTTDPAGGKQSSPQRLTFTIAR